MFGRERYRTHRTTLGDQQRLVSGVEVDLGASDVARQEFISEHVTERSHRIAWHEPTVTLSTRCRFDVCGEISALCVVDHEASAGVISDN